MVIPFDRSDSPSSVKEPILHSCLTQSANQQPTNIGNNHTGHQLSNNSSFRSLSMKLHHDYGTSCDEERDLIDCLGRSELKAVRSHADLAKTVHTVRTLNKSLNRATVQLGIEKVVIITKARDNSLVYLTKELTEWLLQTYPNMTVYVDKKLASSCRFNCSGLRKDIPSANTRLKYWTRASLGSDSENISFVITLGGDGTVLHASTLFQTVVPPIVSFSLGSLGFLTNFDFEDFRDVLGKSISDGVNTDLRMRFTCRVHSANGDILEEQQVLNELTIDRGPSPYVTMLELYGDGELLTVAQADGLIVATPTGSTAYNLSAGGSLVHPEVSGICITPICPHTLSFRPVMVPDSMVLRIKVPERSRSTAWAAFDGRERVEIKQGEYVSVKASIFPFPTVKTSMNGYFASVSRVLNWNTRKEQRSFKHLLSDKNKRMWDEQEGAEASDEDDGHFDIDYSDD